jgi:hypothetical protein
VAVIDHAVLQSAADDRASKAINIGDCRIINSQIHDRAALDNTEQTGRMSVVSSANSQIRDCVPIAVKRTGKIMPLRFRFFT